MINMLMMNTVLIDRIFTQSADDELVLINHFFSEMQTLAWHRSTGYHR